MRANLRTGGEIRRSVAVLAAWARSAEGADDEGRPLELVDSRADRLAAAARDTDPLAFVADREMFGDLVDDARFAEAFRSARESIRRDGVLVALEALA